MRYLAALAAAALLSCCGCAAAFDRAALAADVRAETLRTWQGYVRCAWGHDELRPLSCGAHDWYDRPLGIAPVDGYSTLRLMGFRGETRRIEAYVLHDLDLDRDSYVKTYEIYQRVLGGLLYMYSVTHDRRILARAQDMADRLLPAFRSPTGLPYYYVNLHSGAVRGTRVNVAEAASYVFEFGILSYYTGDPKYYRAGMRAERAIYRRRSPLDLVGQDIDVETGRWLLTTSHVGAYIDSYYEYMYKAWLLLGDPELKRMWDTSIRAIDHYVADPRPEGLWFAQVDMATGLRLNRTTNVWDAYFPGLLTLSGDAVRGAAADKAWDSAWARWHMLPERFDYGTQAVEHGAYTLNPEIMESAWYLAHATHDPAYVAQVARYWRDLRACCRERYGYATIADVRTGERNDLMETFFIAETAKYIWATLAGDRVLDPAAYVLSTEAQPFRKADFDHARAARRLGYAADAVAAGPGARSSSPALADARHATGG